MKNIGFQVAKNQKLDEFYTRYEDIQRELSHYCDLFKDKVVYCNCDDPERSAFWKFFNDVFESWGLKELVATYYVSKGQAFVHRLCNDGSYTKMQLCGDGDFRSNECLSFLMQSDIIVTNPPFSLFREYIKQLVDHRKQFLIIGNLNAVTYKEFFPLLQKNILSLGYTFNKTFDFIVPDNYTLKGKGYVDENGSKHVFVGGICFYTLHNTYSEADYPCYDNYDAIEVCRTNLIPKDYFGKMGVPISFLGKYCPEQFRIIGLSSTVGAKIPEDTPKRLRGGVRFYLRNASTGQIHKRLYDRIVIQRVEQH